MRLLPLLALFACDPAGAPPSVAIVDSGSAWPHRVYPGFEAGLTSTSACSDTWLQAWDPSEGLALELYVGGIVADAGTGTTSRTIDLADPGDDWVRAVSANPIAENYCTDALVPRDVLESWEATAGTLVVTVDGSDTTADPVASWVLTDATFAYQGDTVHIGLLQVEAITVVTAWGG